MQLKERLEKMRVIDMHAHLSLSETGDHDKIKQELELRREQGIFTCFSTGNPGEWRQLEAYRTREELLISFGIHPWYADQYTLEECRAYLEQSDFIGEIGMDSVWCQVPLRVQERQLEVQLQLAGALKKPVILHTKGQEKKISQILRGFQGKACVHWYSGDIKDLEAYLEQDCYFTLGPDTRELCTAEDRRRTAERQVRWRMLREIPAERLFVETDGLSAIAWARGVQEVKVEEISKTLQENLAFAAQIKGMTADALEEQMKKNLRAFLGK